VTIPTRFILSGDTEFARRFIGEGMAHLSKLLHMLSFNKIPTASPPALYLGSGVYIRCVVNFGLTEVYIHADPVIVPDEVAEEIPVGEVPIYYFIRIKCPDAEGYPLDLDGQGGEEALVMDRIILYDLEFNGGDTQDPGDTSCRGWLFTPGGGSVAYDVDIENEVVYFPTGLTTEESAAALAFVTTAAASIPTNETPSPSGMMFDFGQTFFRGRMSDPHKNALIAGMASPTETTTYGVDYRYDVEGYSWPVMVDRRYGLMEAETPTQLAVDTLNITWKWRWSPDDGGDPLTYINDRYWPLLSESSSYYGDFCFYVSDGAAWEWEETGVNPDSYKWYDRFMFDSWKNKIEEEVPPVLQDGFFFAPSTDVATSCFFCLFSSAEPGWDYQGASVFSGSYNIPPVTISAWEVFGEVKADFTGNKEPISIGKIVSPLESIETAEMLFETTGTVPPCSEQTAWFSAYQSMQVSVEAYDFYNRGWYLGLNKYFHYPIILDNGGNTHYYTLYKKLLAADTHRLSSFHAVELNEPESIKTFSSMFAFIEKRSTFVQGRCGGITTPPPSSSPCVCSGATSTFSALPVRLYSAVGVVIYIFAPENLYTSDPETGLVTAFWDIHTARRSTGLINPYRCLDLEEYVNGVLSGIQEELDAVEGISKLATGLAYTMNYYEFGITDGFTRKTTA